MSDDDDDDDGIDLVVIQREIEAMEDGIDLPELFAQFQREADALLKNLLKAKHHHPRARPRHTLPRPRNNCGPLSFCANSPVQSDGRYRIDDHHVIVRPVRDQLHPALPAHGLLVRSATGDPKRNPLLKAVSDYADLMLRLASEFGLTPTARARLATGIGAQPTPSKFTGLINGRDES
jgi:Phage terminase, small subunit